MAFRGPGMWRWRDRRPKVLLWRWRRNPLRRRSDVVEAWVLLGAWACAVLTGVLAGWAAADSMERGLARERAEWHTVRGTLTEAAAAPSTELRSPSRTEHLWTKVTWPGPDGAPHSGQVRVAAGSPAGTLVDVWTDAQGRLVTEPTTPSQARLRSTLVGTLAGATSAAIPFVTGRLLRSRLERRRLDQWGADWARFDPLWGRRQTG
ncbi:Rv1733c family protein [Streptomyces sp. S6]